MSLSPSVAALARIASPMPVVRQPLQIKRIPEVKQTPIGLDVVRGLIPSGPAVVLVYGKSSVGKSFYVSSVAFAISRGVRWNGRRVRQTGVVYISSEGRMGARVRAYEHLEGVMLDGLPFGLLETALDLSDASYADIDDLIAQARQLPFEVGVLVVDTIARNFGAGDPDKTDYMSVFVETCGRFSRALDAVVVGVHHPGKDESRGPRNSYALTAGVDTQILIKEDGDCRVVELEKQRDGVTGEVEAFRLEVVDLGPHPHPDADEDERITSCVAVPVSMGERSAGGARDRLTGQARMARDILSEAIGDSGQSLPQTSTIPSGVVGVRLEEWRRRFAIRYGNEGGDAKGVDAARKAFRRSVDRLRDTGAIQISDPWVWLCR
jgi:hypothetical protein